MVKTCNRLIAEVDEKPRGVVYACIEICSRGL